MFKALFQPHTVHKTKTSGFAIVTVLIFFLIISIVVLTGITTPLAYQIRNSNDLLKARQSFIAAESLNEDGLYRLNTGHSLPASYVLPFTSATATAVVTDIGGLKRIVAQGLSGAFTRTSQATFSQGTGVSFNYGLQTGVGGIQMSGGATVNGSVYSNGDITGSGGPRITGSAFAATISNPTPNQINEGSTTPAYSIVFATTSAREDFGQAFQVSTTSQITEVSLYMKKFGSPANATVRIVSNSSGSPSNTTLASATLSNTLVGSSTFGWVTVAFSSPVSLSLGTTYWLVIDAGNSSANYYIIGGTSGTYASGDAKIGKMGSPWFALNPATLEGYFKLFVGGDRGVISGITIGTGGVGNATAYTVNSSTVAGTIYCTAGSGNNKSCNLSYVEPSATTLPVSDANIADWKEEGSSGTSRGSWVIEGSTNASTTGPMKINGNLDIGGGGSLTINGTLYVTGSIKIEGSGLLKLGSSYGNSSGIIISDGIITLQGGGRVTGNGNTGSYAVLATTNTGSTALKAEGGAGSVVLVAPYGTVRFSGGAGAKSVVGKQMVMEGGATLTYESGLADLTFSSGPSGAWNVDSWQEVSQ